MLSSLFRPKWQHKDWQVRLLAVKQLHPSKDLSTLNTIALNDAEPRVRNAAIAGIESLEALHKLYQDSPHSGDKAFIQQCHCSILCNNDLTPALQAENFILDCEDPQWLAAIVTHCHEASLQRLALTGLNDEKIIYRLLEDSRNHPIWPLLIQQLESEDSLKHAANLIKGRDKRTSQYIRQRLEAIAKQQQAEQQALQQLEHTLERLQSILRSEHTPLLEGILLNIEQQLPSLDQQHALFPDIQQALLACQDKLAEQQQAEQAQLAEQALLQTAQQQLDTLNKTLTLSDDELTQLAEQKEQAKQQPAVLRILLEIENLHQLSQQLNQQLSAIHSNDAQQMDVQQLSEQLEKVEQALATCQRHSTLKNQHFAALQQRQSVLKQGLQQQKKQQDAAINNMDALVKKADDAIANSDFSLVKKLHQQAQQLSKSLTRDQQHKYHAGLQRMQATTQALHDWQEFATDPKRDALCEKMENLIANDMPAVEKAKAIKQIHQEWKALGFCKDQKLWNKFQALSEQAYAPCKLHFEQQKQNKAFNAEQCLTICQHLESFLANIDWQQCDYRAIDKLYRNIESEWQKYAHLERKDYQALFPRYNELMQQISDKLKQEKQKNTDTLKSLVDKAQALADTEDINAALNEYTAIHEEWKAVGISFHKTQRTLWQALRDAGDALYQKRNQQRHEADEVLQENLEKAQAIIVKIQQSTQASEINELKQQFEQIGSLPKNAVNKIRSDYQAALQQLKKQQEQQKQQAFYQQLAEIKHWDEQCTAQEQLGETASQAIPDTWPSDWQAIVQPRLIKTEHALTDEIRTLCIQLEILAEQASPESDNSLRMQLQIKQLAAHFGNGAKDQSAQRLADMYLQWAALASTGVDDYSSYATRFYRVADTLLQP